VASVFRGDVTTPAEFIARRRQAVRVT